jgi:hypothetical protein
VYSGDARRQTRRGPADVETVDATTSADRPTASANLEGAARMTESILSARDIRKTYWSGSSAFEASAA